MDIETHTTIFTYMKVSNKELVDILKDIIEKYKK